MLPLFGWEWLELEQINPGSWLGIFGGGQLGRMFTHVAQARGYHVAVFDAEPICPAGQAADRHLCPTNVDDQGRQQDEHPETDQALTSNHEQGTDHCLELVETFAQGCRAITLEFENVPAAWLKSAARYSLTRPGAEFLEVCQNRVLEKSSLRSAGFPVTPFLPIQSADDVIHAGSKLGWPLVIKTSRSGYDGKGQAVVRSPEGASDAWASLNTDDAIAEQRIDFVAELSMLGARNAEGHVITYPLVENSHANHILDISRLPVSPSLLEYEQDAREIVAGVASHFKVEGLFCVEFFVDARLGLMVNEMAPRPHNSGHLTIEAFPTSQFEQQLRAICNLPLGRTDRYRPAAMVNLLGDLWFEPDGTRRPDLQWSKVFEANDAHLHLYGKAQPRVGRKMGHITCTAATAEEAVERAVRLRAALV
ncbi:MAG: 5-(carboxyamino)imidazole ribonucleotide synthase [Pirellulaceae bacterium]|nr:5-(carboxyamino)imidazole ribonucleotide synthase [Pirellulaceae bacterium]